MICLYPDCSWQPITPSAEGDRKAYLEHVIAEHAETDGAADIEWFEKSPGHRSEWRSSENGQVFIVLEGQLVIHTETTEIELSTSDSVRIGGSERHYSENTGECQCVGLRVSAPEREFSTESR